MDDEVEARLNAKLERYVQTVKQLSAHQRLVLKHVANGLRNDQIADMLNMPISTVIGRMHAIYDAAKIPAHVTSRQARREIVAGMYRAFEEQYDIEADGTVVRKPDIVPAFATEKTMGPAIHTQAATEPDPKANGLAKPPNEVPSVRPASAPPKVVPGYGVGLSITLPDPLTIVDIGTITLGTPEAATRLQELLLQGYVLELMIEFQSLTSMRNVTRVVLIKRR